MESINLREMYHPLSVGDGLTAFYVYSVLRRKCAPAPLFEGVLFIIAVLSDFVNLRFPITSFWLRKEAERNTAWIMGKSTDIAKIAITLHSVIIMIIKSSA